MGEEGAAGEGHGGSLAWEGSIPPAVVGDTGWSDRWLLLEVGGRPGLLWDCEPPCAPNGSFAQDDRVCGRVDEGYTGSVSVRYSR